MKKPYILMIAVLLLLLSAGCGNRTETPAPGWDERIQSCDNGTLLWLAGEETPLPHGIDLLTGKQTAVRFVSEGDAAAVWASNPNAPNLKQLTAGALVLTWRRLSETETDMLYSYWEDAEEERIAVWEEHNASDCAVSCILPAPDGGWLELIADAPGLTRTDLLRVLSGLTVRLEKTEYVPVPTLSLWYSVFPWEETWEYAQLSASDYGYIIPDATALKECLSAFLESVEWDSRDTQASAEHPFFYSVYVRFAGEERSVPVLSADPYAAWVNRYFLSEQSEDRRSFVERFDGWLDSALTQHRA